MNHKDTKDTKIGLGSERRLDSKAFVFFVSLWFKIIRAESANKACY